MEKAIARGDFYKILGIFFLCCAIPFVSCSDFSTRGESREALVVQSMLISGDYLLPRVYNNAIPSKPPLFHWMGAFLSKAFGEMNEFTIRFPSKIFSIIVLGLFLIVLWKRVSITALILFSLILTFSFEWLRASVSARVDMVHSASLACGLLSIFLATEKKRLVYWVLGVLFTVFACLSKGPVAIAITGFVLFNWWMVSIQNLNEDIIPLKYFCVLFISLCFGLTWYYLAYNAAPAEFMQKIWYENFSRMTSTMPDNPHDHGIFYLMCVAYIGTLPWSPYLSYIFYKNWPSSLDELIRRFKKLPSLERFSIIVMCSIFIFYCVPSSKRSVYLLAAYPFFALVSALFIERHKGPSMGSLRILAVIAFVVTFGFQVFMTPILSKRGSEKELAKILESIVSKEDYIYTFAHEFYGAAFYSGRKFLRLEDVNNNLIAGKKLVVMYASELKDFHSFIAVKKITATHIKEVQIGKMTVNLMEIG